jgi:hypothetical protein
MEMVVNCRKSEYDVYIGRPSKWGNPFTIGRDGTRDEVCDKFEEWFLKQPELVEECKQELRGKILGCFCSPKRCHGDFLYKIANEDLKNKQFSI